jgi:DNA-binding GntR family transcriptional regulator
LVDEHRQLRSAVTARDVEAFQATLQAHLDNTHNLFHSR